LVGMNTAILSPSQASAGIGFAVPVETINSVVPRLVRGTSKRAGLGVTLGPDSVLRARRLEGALVLQVLPGSAAEAAGVRGTREDPRTGRIELGDVIVAVEGTPVRGQLELGTVLDAFQPGEAVRVEVLRAGARLALPVTLQPVLRR
ncbi:MAG: S1C family serine protease, partial [Planctomycetia bacterium]